jgi:hypothetical protein
MLRREPSDRPQTYDEVINSLTYAKSFAMKKIPPPRIEAEKEIPLRTIFATLASILLAILGLFFLWQQRSQFFPRSIPSPSPTTPKLVSTQTVVRPLPAPISVHTNTLPPVKKDDVSHRLERVYRNATDPEFRCADVIQGCLVLLQSLSSDSPAYPWIKIHLARSRLLHAILTMETDSLLQADETVDSAKEVLGEENPESIGTTPLKEKIPQFQALVLTSNFPQEPIQGWLSKQEAWIRAYYFLDSGLLLLRKKQYDEGFRQLQRFTEVTEEKSLRPKELSRENTVSPSKSDDSSSKVTDPHDWHSIESSRGWAFYYLSPIHQIIEEWDSFQSLHKKIEHLRENSQFDDMKKEFVKRQDQWHLPFIKTLVADLNEQSRIAKASAQKAQTEAKANEIREQLEAEASAIRETRKETDGLLRNYQFSDILSLWEKLDSQIKSPDGRKRIQYEIKTAEYLVRFSENLSEDILKLPYDDGKIVTRSNMRMIGKLYTIKDGKLLFRTEIAGGHAEIQCRWNEVLPSSMFALAEFYLEKIFDRNEPRNREVASRALSLAIFAKEFGLAGTLVQRYQRTAIQTGANIADDLLLLQPRALD